MPTFSFPTLIHFGPGARTDVGPHLQGAGRRAPAVVTDKGLAALPAAQGAAGERARRRPRARRSSRTSPAIPSRARSPPGVAAYRAHEADGIIGLGGGAALDVAKAIALMADPPGRRSSTTRTAARTRGPSTRTSPTGSPCPPPPAPAARSAAARSSPTRRRTSRRSSSRRSSWPAPSSPIPS